MTFAAVIADHVLLGIASSTNVAAGGVGLLFRYTRYSFFALTGFVLTYQYRNRELKPVQFWRRRFKLIGLPYVAWSLFYWVYGRYRDGGGAALRNTVDSPDHLLLSLKSIGYDLLMGTAWYHLYFLFVSMQIYLVFPALLWVLKKTWGYHRYLLLVSFACHLALLYFMVRPPAEFFTHGPQRAIWFHLVSLIFPYQFFILAGAVAAMHYEAFQAFMYRWRWPVIGCGVLVVAGTLVYYERQTDAGESIFRTSNVFMLHNAFAFIAIIAMLYAVGSIWQARRTPGSIPDRFMKTAADRSFGIYLVHGLALNELEPDIDKHLGMPTLVIGLIAYVLTVGVTVFCVEVLRRSPISLITTGRETIPADEQNPRREVLVALAGIAVGVVVRTASGWLVGDLITAVGVLLLVSAGVVAIKQRRNQRPPADGSADEAEAAGSAEVAAPQAGDGPRTAESARPTS